MKYQGVQQSAAAAVVVLAILMAFDPGGGWAARRPSELRQQLHGEIMAALGRSILRPEQKAAFVRQSQELRELGSRRRAGQPVDEARIEVLRRQLLETLESGAFRGVDRDRIYQLMREMRSAQTELRIRARREEFVKRFGLPVGLLAEWVASRQLPIPQGS
jgi:hypothetical protein